MRRNKCTARGGGQIRQQSSDHEPVDFTRSTGSVGVGIELPYTSWDRNKVCWTQDRYTSQEPTQWMAREEAICSSRSKAESNKKYTVFTVPFSLHSASATFQRVLDQVIFPEMSPHAFAYQNGIIVIGRTLEEPKANLREVFRRLKEANLRLNPEKCQLFKNELLYLGHRVNSEGIGT